MVRLDQALQAGHGALEAAAVAAVLASNPGLAAEGARLHAGTLVGLPDEVAPVAAPRLVDIWE